MGLSKKICHAELGSASALYIVKRFRNEFGMTLCNELIRQPHLFALQADSCGGFHTPTLGSKKGYETRLQYLMRTTNPDACIGIR